MREALGFDGCVREVFVTREALERHDDLAALLSNAPLRCHVCDDEAIASLAGSVTPQGVVAVCGFVDCALDVALSLDTAQADRLGLVAVAANVRDPGNVGTLIRSADAAGADAVILAGSSADPYNDKAVRASVGSLVHRPLGVGTALEATLEALRARRFTVVAAEGTAEERLDAVVARSLGDRVAWVFGNEAWGFSPADLALCERQVAVPVYGRAESLNVATAAAVCLYATAWAQREGRPTENVPASDGPASEGPVTGS